MWNMEKENRTLVVLCANWKKNIREYLDKFWCKPALYSAEKENMMGCYEKLWLYTLCEIKRQLLHFLFNLGIDWYC